MKTVILKNGLVYDPLTKELKIRDIGILGTRIADVDSIDSDQAAVIDVTGCLVTPGLIDYHIHLYSGCDGAVKADIMTLPTCVTTAVDGGTCGVSNYEMFQKTDIVQSTVRIKSYLNVSPTGLATAVYPENVDPRYYDLEKMKELFRRYPDQLVAVKFRISKSIVGPTGLTKEPLERAIEIAEELHCPVVVHMNDPVIKAEEAAAMLRPGDVFCHMYYGTGDTIIDESGHVKKGIRKARERGVLFDACNGKGNFEYKTALPAVREGLYPDIISTDISPMTQYMHPVISLPRLLSKYMAMGMTLTEVLDAAILAPARQLHMETELASLNAGSIADIAVFKIREKEVKFFDLTGEYIKGDKVLVPQLTIKDGTVVYRQTDLD